MLATSKAELRSRLATSNNLSSSKVLAIRDWSSMDRVVVLWPCLEPCWFVLVKPHLFSSQGLVSQKFWKQSKD
jgi:hypothetical protein